MARHIDRWFGVTAAGSSIRTEVTAGVTTFFTAAFILTVNPLLVNTGLGLAKEDVVVSTAVISAVATATIALVTNKPYACVPAMGINAFVALTVSKNGEKPEQALAAALVAGVILVIEAGSGVLTRLSGFVPESLRIAAVAGIGVFISLVGATNVKLIEAGAIGDLEDPAIWLFVGGFLLMLSLDTIGCRNAVLITMILVTALAWGSGLAEPPARVVDVPSDFTSVWRISFSGWDSSTYRGLVTLVYTDILVQTSALMAVSSLPGMRPPSAPRGDMPPYAWKVWLTTGFADCASASFGSTPFTIVMESAAGIRSGGRTGLTSIVVAVLFGLSSLLSPLLASFPPEATSCPLVLVGILMFSRVHHIDWSDMHEAAPAFVTIVMIPFTFDVGTGVLAGLLVSIVCNISMRVGPTLRSLQFCRYCLDKSVLHSDTVANIVPNPVVGEIATHDMQMTSRAHHTSPIVEAMGTTDIAIPSPTRVHHTSPITEAMVVDETYL